MIYAMTAGLNVISKTFSQAYSHPVSIGEAFCFLVNLRLSKAFAEIRKAAEHAAFSFVI